ncbi:MAG: hypothetical protein AAGF77_11900, partial [Bacteroidota bacterium]
MMRTLLLKYSCLACLMLSFTARAGEGEGCGSPKGKYTKEKTVKRDFKVNADALLKVKNSYGNLNLKSWDQDRVVIEVQIKANGNNAEKVQERLEEISVDFDNSAE